MKFRPAYQTVFSAPVQTGPGAHPASCTMGTGSFPGVKSGRGVTLTPHPLLVPWSWKSRAIPLLPLWAVQPVQSLSACTGVHFTFTFTLCLTVIYIEWQIAVSHRYGNFSWWWAHSRPKQVEKSNKHTKKNCALSWFYLQDCTRMHGQQNIKVSNVV